MSKARILAVDDQRYFRELLEALLCDEGYEVTTAESGAQALAAIEREDFDVVITDLVMPEMDGAQLVERVRTRKADQEIVIITGAGDVKAAAEAMKLGARDFLLKPFDRRALTRSLDRLLQQRTLREEHAELVARNLELMGAVSLYERAAGLFAAPGLEALGERLLDALCMETRGQGGVLWISEEGDDPRFQLTSLRGLVRADRELQELSLGSLDGAVVECLRAGRSVVHDDDARSSLWVPLRDGDRLTGFARISDKLESARFGEPDRTQADRFTQIAAPAVANALRLRALERRSFRDPHTGAYSTAYLHDVARNEIRKAARFGRPLSLVRIALHTLGEPGRAPSAAEREEWSSVATAAVAGLLRATDLAASPETSGEGGTHIEVLLPETDGIGASTLKLRLLDVLHQELASAQSDAEPSLDRPVFGVASASYPADGNELPDLLQTLDVRTREHLASPARRFERSDEGLAGILATLCEEGDTAPPRLPSQLRHFVCDELARRPAARGLLFAHAPAAAGGSTESSWTDELGRLGARLEGSVPRTQIVLLGDPEPAEREALAGLDLTWASPEALGEVPPFVVYCGEGPTYVAVGDSGEGESFFHSSDRTLAERLSLCVQRELGLGASGA